MYTHTNIHTCIYIYIYLYVCVCIYICICICICICMYLCMYIYIYMYTHMCWLGCLTLLLLLSLLLLIRALRILSLLVLFVLLLTFFYIMPIITTVFIFISTIHHYLVSLPSGQGQDKHVVFNKSATNLLHRVLLLQKAQVLPRFAIACHMLQHFATRSRIEARRISVDGSLSSTALGFRTPSTQNRVLDL